MRGNIEKIEIDLPMKNAQRMHNRVDIPRANKVIFDKLIFLDKKNSGKVKQIEFIINDDYSLHRCAMILIYLMNNRDNISHIEWFKIRWLNIEQDIGANSSHIQVSSEQHERESMV